MAIDEYPTAPEQVAYLSTFSNNTRENTKNAVKMMYSSIDTDGTADVLISAKGIVPSTSGFIISIDDNYASNDLINITSGYVIMEDLVIGVGAVTGLSITDYFVSWSYETVTSWTDVAILLKYTEREDDPIEIGMKKVDSWYPLSYYNETNYITLGFVEFRMSGGYVEFQNVKDQVRFIGTTYTRSIPSYDGNLNGGVVSGPDMV